MDRPLLVSASEHETLEARPLPCCALGQIFPDPLIASDNDPVTLGAEPLDPVDIFGVVREAVVVHLADVSSLMTKRTNEGIERPGKNRRCAVIEEDLQAARFSKAMARLTELCGTM
jgi:hypothetical protein